MIGLFSKLMGCPLIIHQEGERTRWPVGPFFRAYLRRKTLYMTIRTSKGIQASRLAGLIPILCLSLIVSACGKKSFPTPSEQEVLPEVRDLQAVVTSKGVELSWQISEGLKTAKGGSQYRISVWKADLKWENRNCLDCPAPGQQEVQKIFPAQPQPAYIQNDRMIWLDTVVSKNRAYRYQVAVQENRGRPLSISNPVIAKVVPAPQSLKSLEADTQQNGILLHWKASNKDVQGQTVKGELEFLVERHSQGGQWEKLSPVPIKASSFLDKSIASKEAYDYRVTPILRFEDTSILGEPAVFRQAKAPGTLPPPPPKNVWVIPSKGTLEVHWVESDGKVEGYHVYRREGKEIIRLTATPVQKAPYVDRTVKKNTVYYYAVSGVNSQADQQEGLLSKWVEVRSVLFE